MCIIIESVACRSCRPVSEVEKAIGAFMDGVFCAVAMGHTVTVAGFGAFWPKAGGMRFSRLTLRSRPRLDVLNTAPENHVCINNNNIGDDWPWHNTVRTRHLDGDPLYMSVLVEANRRVYFKKAEFSLCCWNVPVFVITQENSRFYKSEEFGRKTAELVAIAKGRRGRLRMWVPRLVCMLLACQSRAL